jgi:hypothetical protein
MANSHPDGYWPFENRWSKQKRMQQFEEQK